MLTRGAAAREARADQSGQSTVAGVGESCCQEYCSDAHVGLFAKLGGHQDVLDVMPTADSMHGDASAADASAADTSLQRKRRVTASRVAVEASEIPRHRSVSDLEQFLSDRITFSF